MNGRAGLLALICLVGCVPAPTEQPDQPAPPLPSVPQFGPRESVTITGYTGNLMEPFLSRDGQTLFFNNLNSAPENTNLHVATRVNDNTFTYQGELSGVNTPDLEAVASLDATGRLVFVSNRSYVTSLQTLYTGQLASGSVSAVTLLSGDFARLQAGYLNMDAEISANGERLYVVDSRFEGGPVPTESDIRIAQRQGSDYRLLSNWAALLSQVNTPSALEYAPALTPDELQLYFTRAVPATVTFGIYVCVRSTRDQPFGPPSLITSATGPIQEAPTLSPDGRILYYHAFDGSLYRLYLVRRTN